MSAPSREARAAAHDICIHCAPRSHPNQFQVEEIIDLHFAPVREREAGAALMAEVERLLVECKRLDSGWGEANRLALRIGLELTSANEELTALRRKVAAAEGIAEELTKARPAVLDRDCDTSSLDAALTMWQEANK